MRLHGVLVAFLLASAGVAAAQTDPVVSVTGGNIRGRLTSDGGAAFKRIPYARPPLGDLRWRAPQPVEPWNGVRDAAQFSVACTQLSERWNVRFVSTSGEDCLYLNVAAPEWPARKTFPVMAWIHGGSNTTGDADDAGFDARTLVHRGIVLLTIGYRLDALGFLVHPELTSESPHHASGNYGLMDQIAALRWVHENIAKFGGDAGNVTIFGESAGALDVGLLMTSPLAQGLFQRVIQESGAVSGFHGTPTEAQAAEIGLKLAARLNAPGHGAIPFLRTIPPRTILEEARIASGGDRTGLETSIDGWVLPERPAQVFANGRAAPVPLLLGSNAQEYGAPPTIAMLREAIRKTDGDLAGRALELYGLSKDGTGTTDPVLGAPGMQWATDVGFRCPATEEAIGHSAAGNSVYQYEFEQPPPGRPVTAHASELGFLFGLGNSAQLTPADRKVSEQMQAYWTNFARSGDPNGAGLPPWPKFTIASQAYVAFMGDGAAAKSGLRRSFCEVWRRREKALATVVTK